MKRRSFLSALFCLPLVRPDRQTKDVAPPLGQKIDVSPCGTYPGKNIIMINCTAASWTGSGVVVY